MAPYQLPYSQAQWILYDQPQNSLTVSVSGALLSERFSSSCNTPISLALHGGLRSWRCLHPVPYLRPALELKSRICHYNHSPSPSSSLLPLLHLSSSGTGGTMLCHPSEWRCFYPSCQEHLWLKTHSSVALWEWPWAKRSCPIQSYAQSPRAACIRDRGPKAGPPHLNSRQF